MCLVNFTVTYDVFAYFIEIYKIEGKKIITKIILETNPKYIPYKFVNFM